MKDHVISTLKAIEDISILFAVESGSRAWGMESKNSDYDIRYVYHYPVNQYLRLFSNNAKTKSTFSTKNDIELDFTGWDIYKFLRLVGKSNPTALEWIRSPIIYQDHSLRKQLLDITNDFSRFSLFKHYQSMALNNYHKYIKDKTDASTKRYLYVLRGIINAIYIYETLEFPPIELVNTIHTLENTKRWELSVITNELLEIIKIKKHGNETDSQEISSSLKFWIIESFEMIEEVENDLRDKDVREIDKNRLEQVLIEVLGIDNYN